MFSASRQLESRRYREAGLRVLPFLFTRIEMSEIDLKCTPKVSIGPLARLGTGVSEWGSRALLIADKSLEVRAADIQDQLDSEGISTILFAREGISSDTETLDEALSLARGSHADMIGVLGGEKVLSLGRLVASTSRSILSAADLMSGRTPDKPGLPILEIPSSGRFTLLFRNEALLNDSQSQRAVLVPLEVPPAETVLIDTSITGKLPVRASALSMASLLFSAVEAFLSPRSDFFSDIQARSAIRTAAGLLREVKEQAVDPDYRIREAETAVLAAFSTGLTGLGPGMILSWAVSAASETSKAGIAAVLLAWVLESPLYAGSPKLKELAGLIADSAEDAADSPAGEVRSLFGRLDLPGRLRELGVELSNVLQASAWAVDILGAERPDLNEGVFREILDLSS